MKKELALVLGLGISGQSAASFLLSHQTSVYGVDKKDKEIKDQGAISLLINQGMTLGNDQEELNLDSFDFIVVSPGIPHTHPLYIKAKASGKPILGEVELACRFLKGTVLAITGTNGKTTVTLLTEHILNQSGKKAIALGNVGTPLTSQLENATGNDPIVVLELSSFQLETMHTKVIDAGVLLNITPDHLDRYENMESYAKAKFAMTRCLKENAPFFVAEHCLREFGYLNSFENTKSFGFFPHCYFSTDLKNWFINQNLECPLPPQWQTKSHHLENIMASYALCKHVGVSSSQFFSALASFKKPSHRIEFVRTLNQVHYYDDSKGTNIDAVVRAVDSFNSSIVLIAGGVDKGAAYTPWIENFGEKVRCIYAIGQAAEKIEKDVSHAIPVIRCDTLEKAVLNAFQVAEPDEIVLLSPGCSSYDMFRDYAHRGNEFQRIVHNL